MKIRPNPLILGAFIVGAVVLAIIAFLAIGSTNLFRPTGHFIFYLSGSAQGMAEGAAVKVDGVRVGRVDQVNVLYDRNSRESYVGVICQINENRLTDFQGGQIKLTDREVLKKMVANGLYAQVQTSGLVGAKFVGLGFNSDTTAARRTGLPPSPYPVVPTKPSTMSEMTGNISQILSNLHQANFAGVVKQVQTVLASVNRQLGELETNQLTAHISSAAVSVDHFMSSSELHGAAVQVRSAADALQNLVTNLNQRVPTLATNLDSTLLSANQTAQRLQDFLAVRSQLGRQTEDLINQLNRTARSIEQFADFLKRHPNALITGRVEPAQSP